jgi:hypothetical protein
MTAYFTHIIIYYYYSMRQRAFGSIKALAQSVDILNLNCVLNWSTTVLFYLLPNLLIVFWIPDGKMNSNGKKDYDFLFKVDRQLKAVVVLCHGRMYVIMFVSMV